MIEPLHEHETIIGRCGDHHDERPLVTGDGQEIAITSEVCIVERQDGELGKRRVPFVADVPSWK